MLQLLHVYLKSICTPKPVPQWPGWTTTKKLQTPIVNWSSHWPIIDGNATWTVKVKNKTKLQTWLVGNKWNPHQQKQPPIPRKATAQDLWLIAKKWHPYQQKQPQLPHKSTAQALWSVGNKSTWAPTPPPPGAHPSPDPIGFGFGGRFRAHNASGPWLGSGTGSATVKNPTQGYSYCILPLEFLTLWKSQRFNLQDLRLFRGVNKSLTEQKNDHSRRQKL